MSVMIFIGKRLKQTYETAQAHMKRISGQLRETEDTGIPAKAFEKSKYASPFNQKYIMNLKIYPIKTYNGVENNASSVPLFLLL